MGHVVAARWVKERPPLKYPVLPGVVRVDATAPRHASVHNEVTVAAGEVSEATLDLPLLPPEPAALPQAMGTPVIQPSAHHGAREATSGRTLRTLGWIGIGAAVAGVGVGAVALGLREESASTFNQECPLGPTNSLSAECLSRYDAGGTLSSVALGGFLVGGVAAVAAVVLFVVAPSSRGPEATTRAWVCGPQLVTRGAACVGRF